jgi:4-hydroxy-3-polyprenylbenzoate decarboxylase
LERADWKKDLHFHTQTTIDTLDYSGSDLNSGSKLVIAAAGDKIKELATVLPDANLPDGFYNPKLVMPGVIAIKTNAFVDEQQTVKEVEKLNNWNIDYSTYPLLIICDDSNFVAQTLNNFLWITFTRSNPSHDIHGIQSFVENKHWGCRGSLIIDARVKPHHAPELIKDPSIERRVDALGEKGKSLFGII